MHPYRQAAEFNNGLGHEFLRDPEEKDSGQKEAWDFGLRTDMLLQHTLPTIVKSPGEPFPLQPRNLRLRAEQ